MSSKDQENKLYSVAEAAIILQISRVAVNKQIRTGRLPAQKVGRNYVISHSALSEAAGVTLSEGQRHEIAKVVKKAVKEYGRAFKRLGREE